MTELTWEKALESKYISFVPGEARFLTIIDWKLEEDVDQEGKTRPFFRCKVVAEDKKECDRVIDSSSKPLMRALRPILESKNAESAVSLRIKALGDGVKRTYDVEVQ